MKIENFEYYEGNPKNELGQFSKRKIQVIKKGINHLKKISFYSSLLESKTGKNPDFRKRLNKLLDNPKKNLIFKEYFSIAVKDYSLQMRPDAAPHPYEGYVIWPSPEDFTRNCVELFVDIYLGCFDSQLGEIVCSFEEKYPGTIKWGHDSYTYLGERIKPIVEPDLDANGYWADKVEFYESE